MAWAMQWRLREHKRGAKRLLPWSWLSDLLSEVVSCSLERHQKEKENVKVTVDDVADLIEATKSELPNKVSDATLKPARINTIVLRWQNE